MKTDTERSISSPQDDLPEELLPLKDRDFIDVEKGLRNNGSTQTYLETLKVYDDTLDSRISDLSKCIREEDYSDYTVKVHALKSGLRIIGAEGLGEEAQKLENAGKESDPDYIMENHEGFISRCKVLREAISMVFARKESLKRKPVADDEFMSAVLGEIKGGASDWDMDKIDAIFSEMEEYTIPETCASLWEELKTAAELYDYDKIIKLCDRN